MAKLDKFIIDNTTYELVPEIAPLFNSATSYSVGDCVIHDAVLYKFTANHAAGAWTGNDVVAFEVGSELVRLGSGASGSGLTEDIKTALLACFENVAWINEDGQDYYDALYSALYPPADLVSISAVFTQGSAVIYDTDSLDTLKQYLVVTAHMSDSTTQTVTGYTLSGTLTEGTSIITVSYGGKTTTFNVTVSVSPYVQNGLIAYWDGINNTANGHDSTVNKWTDLINGYELTFIETTRTTWGNDAVILTGGGSKQGLYCDDFWTMPQDATIEIVIAPSESRTACVATFDRDGDGSGSGANVRRFAIFNDNTIGFVGASGNTYANPENSLLAIRKLVAEYTDFSVNRAFVNGTAVSLSSKTHSFTFSGSPQIRIGYENTASASYHFIGKIHAIRVYNRQLTTEELVKNLNYDNIRFSLGLTL